MSKIASISLPDPISDFIEQQVATGRYASPSEVIEASLRLMKEDEEQIEAVRAALIEGEQSGPAEPFDFDEFIARMRSGG
jgi:antitoxin ParD1/3/4